MRIRIVTIIIAMCAAVCSVAASSLSQWKVLDIENFLVDDFHPYPVYGDKQWLEVPDSISDVYIHEAEKLINTSWPAMPATLFMQFRATGNRNDYQAAYFERRKNLNTLVMAEMLEQKGRFLPDIVNGVWATCEETWWGLPAHYDTNLPDTERQTVAIYSSQTAGDLAWTQYLLRKEFDRISPLINQRISSEIERRQLSPCRQQRFGWMTAVSNWNPWVCSNWLAAILLSDDTKRQKAEDIKLVLDALDVFYASYPEDGGCEEGPGYWANAGGALFDCVYLLHQASNGQFDLSGEKKFRNIGNFITRIYMGNNRFINHGDSSAKTNTHPGLVFTYGLFIGSEQMKSFATIRRDELIANGQPLASGKGESMGRFVYTFVHLKELLAQERAIPFERDVWLPDLHLFSTRAEAGSCQGLALAVKGGHNDQSHNHNDIGSYIVYADGDPLLVDVGPEAYNGKSFTKERYTIWTTRSAYHNAPLINGCEQAPGKAYRSTDETAVTNKRFGSFSIDVAKAYPAEADVKRWTRNCVLLRKEKRIRFEEDYELGSHKAPSEIVVMTCAKPLVTQAGEITLPFNGKVYRLSYDKRQLKADTEEIDLTDEGLKRMWGHLYRIRLQILSESPAGKVAYELKQTDK